MKRTSVQFQFSSVPIQFQSIQFQELNSNWTGTELIELKFKWNEHEIHTSATADAGAPATAASPAFRTIFTVVGAEAAVEAEAEAGSPKAAVAAASAWISISFHVHSISISFWFGFFWEWGQVKLSLGGVVHQDLESAWVRPDLSPTPFAKSPK